MASIELTGEERKLAVVAAVFIAVFLGAEYGLRKFSETYTAELRSENRKLNSDFSKIQKQLSEIVDEERQQQQFVEKYLAYDQQGLIKTPSEAGAAEVEQADEEQRLSWLSRLQEIRSDRKLFKLNYDLSPPEVLDPNFSSYTEGSTVAVRTNSMRMALPLLHELDLLMLINDFYDESDNRFVNTSCSIRRLTSGFELGLNQNLEGECELIWLTVFDPEKIVEEEEAQG